MAEKSILLTSFQNIEISSMSVAVPKEKVNIESYNALFGEEAVASIASMTGIKSVRRAKPEQTASDLAFEAASDLFLRSGIDKDEVGVLIFVTQKPDYRIPSTAFILQDRLGIGNKCVCFDINLACQGFVFGLHTAMSMLSRQEKHFGLLLTGDTSIRTISPYDRSTVMLFGDNGTATLLKRSEKAPAAFTALRTDSTKFKSVIVPSGAYRNMGAPFERRTMEDGVKRSEYELTMKGMDVFGWSITAVPLLIKEYMAFMNTSPEDYDSFALHQANMYILKQISRKIKIPPEKLLVSIERFGNNSVSSIPLVLSDHYGAGDHGVKKVFFCGFGSGLSWGCGEITLDTKVVNPIIYTDNHYIVQEGVHKQSKD